MLLVFSEQCDLVLWFLLPAFCSWSGQTVISSSAPKLQIYVFGHLSVIPPSKWCILATTKRSLYFPPNLPLGYMHAHFQGNVLPFIQSPKWKDHVTFASFFSFASSTQLSPYISLIKIWTYLSSAPFLFFLFFSILFLCFEKERQQEQGDAQREGENHK